MPKRIRILVLAAIVAAIFVPLGFALSLESSAGAASASRDVVPMLDAVAGHSQIIVSTTHAVTTLPDIPEGAKLVVIGAALFGLAAAMRRGRGNDV